MYYGIMLDADFQPAGGSGGSAERGERSEEGEGDGKEASCEHGE